MKAGTGENTTNEIYVLSISEGDEEKENFIIHKSGAEIKNNEKNLNKNKEIFKTEKKYLYSNEANTNTNHTREKIGKIINKIKVYIFFLASLCTCLDGFILIFIWYNSSILTKEWKWQENSMLNLDILYHLVSALGGILSILTTHHSTMNGLNYSIIFSIIAFFLSLFLLNIQKYFLYVIIFFVICLSNGHLQNISTTLIIKKFASKNRAAVYVFAYFFTQFGKFLFAYIIFKNSEIIANGNLSYTVYPILAMIIMQIAVNFLLVNKMKEKIMVKKNNEIVGNDISNFNINIKEKEKDRVYINAQQIIENNYTSFLNNKTNHNIFSVFFTPVNKLINSHGTHFFNLTFLNLSLGIQFFSMINVFPVLKNKSSLILVDEIFFSKAYHTLFLLFLPILFLLKSFTRKFLLTFTFWSSLFFNILILFNIFNSSVLIHLFRFIWNVCFISINLYSAESVSKKLRGVNTSIMYLIFKISCVVEILTIDKFISFSIYVPIFLNIVILIGDILLVNKLDLETHMKSIEDIEVEINYLHSR